MEREISFKVFEKFYTLLSERFFEKYFKDVPANARPNAASRSMWEERKEESKKEFRTRSHEYFYRRYAEAVKFGKSFVEAEPFALALIFIGIQIPPDIEKKVPLYIDKEPILYKEFLKKYFGDSDLSGKEPLSDDHKQLVIDIDKTNVTNLVLNFYYFLSTKDSRANSWNLLSPDYRERVWGSKFDRFEEGYKNFRGVYNLHVFNVNTEIHPNEASCLVYYDDEVEAFSAIELEGLYTIQVRDVDKLLIRVNEMRERASSLNITGFDNIEVSKLFDPVASEYIWYKCNFSPEQFSFFSAKRTQIIKRLYQCACQRIDDRWYIKGLRQLTTFSSR